MIMIGKNIFGDIKTNYPPVSEESIILRNPEIIFLFSDRNISLNEVKNRKNWHHIQAVKNNNII